jgi:hypothetical protein
MATLFKDYSKDCNDLLTKNFAAPGEWKVENKAKATKGSYAIGTTSNLRGDVIVDAEGLTVDGACYGKLTVTPKLLNDVKATVRMENVHGHRVEAIVTKKGAAANNVAFELNHETVAPLASGRLRVNDKVTDKIVELGLSMAVADGLQVGAGATYNIKGQSCDWSLACRANANKNTTVTVRTTALRDVEARLLTTAFLHPKFQPRVSGMVAYDVQASAVKYAVGAEWGCQVVLGNTAKARVNEKLEWMLSYVAALKGGWTLTVSLDKKMKAGVTLTRN